MCLHTVLEDSVWVADVSSQEVCGHSNSDAMSLGSSSRMLGCYLFIYKGKETHRTAELAEIQGKSVIKRITVWVLFGDSKHSTLPSQGGWVGNGGQPLFPGVLLTPGSQHFGLGGEQPLWSFPKALSWKG